MIHQHL
jgi:hypothetical protein